MGIIFRKYAKWFLQDHLVFFWIGEQKCCFFVIGLAIWAQKAYIERKKMKQNKTNVEYACSNLVFNRFSVNNNIFEDIER